MEAVTATVSESRPGVALDAAVVPAASHGPVQCPLAGCGSPGVTSQGAAGSSSARLLLGQAIEQACLDWRAGPPAGAEAQDSESES